MGSDNYFKKLRTGLPVLDGRFRLFVSQDGLEAYLKPEEHHEFLKSEDYPQLKKILEETGIVYGILDPPQLEPPLWIVARGRPPEPGENARLQFLIELKKGPKKKGAYLDYREVNTLLCCHAEQPIAKKIPPRPGKPGRNIFGQTIPPPPVKDISLRLGKNVVFEEETGLIKAACAGVLNIDQSQGKIEINPEYTLPGDVDWDVGNITFFGKRLLIQGSVRRGFKVYVEGDLEIAENVEDETTIEVKGNLIIGGLVHGPSQITCHGETRLAEVEYAQIKSKESLIISEYALQVDSCVEKDLIVTEGVGAIIGGKHLVRGNILARVLGSRAGIKTIVYAGCDPLLNKRLEEINQQINLIEKEKTPIKKILQKALILYRLGKLSPEQIRAFEKLKNQLEKLRHQEEKLFRERESVYQRFKELEKAQIVVLSHVFPGVEVGLGRYRYSVVTSQGKGYFYLKGKQIIFKKAS